MTILINNEQDKGTATEIDKEKLTGILLRTTEMFPQNSLAKSPSLQKNEKSDGYNPVIPLGQKSFLKYALSLVVRAFPLKNVEFDDEEMDRFILKTALKTITLFPNTGNGVKVVLGTASTSPRSYSQQLAYVSDPRLSRHMDLTFDKKYGLELVQPSIVGKESEIEVLHLLKQQFTQSLTKTMAEEILAIHHGENDDKAVEEEENSEPKNLEPVPDPGFILARLREGGFATKIEYLGYEELGQDTEADKTKRLKYKETESAVHLNRWEGIGAKVRADNIMAATETQAVQGLEPVFMAELIDIRPKHTGMILFYRHTSQHQNIFTVVLNAYYHKAKE